MLRGGSPAGCFHVTKALYETVGLDRSGRQCIDPHFLRCVVRRHRLGKLDERSFGCAVDGAARSSYAAELRSNVNDAAAARLDHRGKDRATHQECTADIDGKYLVPVSQTKFEDRSVRIIASRPIHKNMDGGKLGEYRFGGRLDFAFTAHVARNSKCRRTDFCRSRVSRSVVQIKTGDVRSRRRECKRDCTTDTVTGARNDSGLARE